MTIPNEFILFFLYFIKMISSKTCFQKEGGLKKDEKNTGQIGREWGSKILNILDTMVLYKGHYQKCSDSILWLINSFPINLITMILSFFQAIVGYTYFGENSMDILDGYQGSWYSSRKREQ